MHHNLEAAIAAKQSGIADRHALLVKIEQHALVLQAVEPDDSVRADIAAFEQRRSKAVEAASAEVHLVDLHQIDRLLAGNADKQALS
ncbi:MAG: hypothetical protein ACKVOL_07900 [Novosphingobium sp.]